MLLERIELPLSSQNALLRHLGADVLAEIVGDLESYPLQFGDVIFGADDVQKHVLFVTTGIVSSLAELADGTSAEIGLVGNEGAIGLGAILGGSRTAFRSEVQMDGHAFRLPAALVHDLMDRHPEFRKVMYLFAQVAMTQFAQSAICGRYHTIAQQFCRWILMSLDRADSNEVRMTQQLLSEMLGVRREAVSAVAADLKERGIITYSRGTLIVLDRRRLAEESCECYAALRNAVECVLPGSTGKHGGTRRPEHCM